MKDAPAVAFSPVLPPLERPPRGQLLGKFVPTAVRRMPPGVRPSGPLRLVWTSVLTLGIWPLIQLRERLYRLTTLQQQQLELSAELLAQHLPADAAKLVADAADEARPFKPMASLSGVVMIAAILCAIISIQQGGWTLESIRSLLFYPPSVDRPFALAWTALLICGFGLCWMQLNQHIGKLQQFTLAFNAVAADRAGSLSPPKLVFGVRPVYLICAVLMMLFWMIWALPMMLAWAAFRSFVLRGDRAFRTALADRLTAISGEQPVVADVAACTNPNCRASSPADARYCPRCGKSLRVD